ncbi:hypothetical protein F4818DRAFT_454868 [Hypoxylon cercidicola]|nr:hypothetical protein F4818DRAFT_454868 [Hypoxylon cercidicola]
MYGAQTPDPLGGDSTSEPPSPLTNREAKCIKTILRNFESIERTLASTGTDNSKREAATATNHNNETQASQQPFICPTCNKHFKSIRTLRQHLGEVHIGTKCYWPGCTANVPTEKELNKHLKAHNSASAEGLNGTTACNWPGCGNPMKVPEVAKHLRRHTVKAKNAALA